MDNKLSNINPWGDVYEKNEAAVYPNLLKSTKITGLNQ